MIFCSVFSWCCVPMLGFCILSLMEAALHSDWDKNQGEKELFLTGVRAMGSDVVAHLSYQTGSPTVCWLRPCSPSSISPPPSSSTCSQ